MIRQLKYINKTLANLPFSALHPVLQLLLQAGITALFRYLRDRDTAAARVAKRIALAMLMADSSITLRSWLERELPKLEREIRALSPNNPHLIYALAVLAQLQKFLKEIA